MKENTRVYKDVVNPVVPNKIISVLREDYISHL